MFGPSKQVFDEKVRAQKSKGKKELPTPAPGSGCFTSFEKAMVRGSSSTIGRHNHTPRTSKAKQGDTPGPASFSPRADTQHSSSAVISAKRNHSRKRVPSAVTPAPGERGSVYTSFGRASEKRTNRPTTPNKRRSGSASGDPFFQHWADSPGPAAYSPKVQAETPYTATLGTRGESKPHYIQAVINSHGFIPVGDPATKRAPGDCNIDTDFDISAKTFNHYAKSQAETKTRKSCSPSLAGSPARSRSSHDRSSVSPRSASTGSPRKLR